MRVVILVTLVKVAILVIHAIAVKFAIHANSVTQVAIFAILAIIALHV
ncbi:MAG: hypothetical protein JTT12_05510 [Candidatus Brockarchaeota archaeon]|nr:hypothetical protein [Candidatus Brockarchaeota archaeon]